MPICVSLMKESKDSIVNLNKKDETDIYLP